MGRVIHFEIHADEPVRAAAFYSAVFGWDIRKWDNPSGEYWLVTTGSDDTPGINGGLMPRRAPLAGMGVNAYVCTVDVASIDDTLRAIDDQGGQNVVAKWEVPGLGWLAYCKDTEGNIFGLNQAP